MRFTVVWSEDVQNDITAYWISSPSDERRRITTAANLIDRELARAPDQHGEVLPSEPSQRVWQLPGIDPPVRVVFEVLPDERLVRILRIRMDRA